MKMYEVIVSLHADKTILVRANDENEAEKVALELLESGKINMSDAEVEDYVSDICPATEKVYELSGSISHSDNSSEDEDDEEERYFYDIFYGRADNDVIRICEKCDHCAECDNETKYEHVGKILTRDYMERMADLMEAYME